MVPVERGAVCDVRLLDEHRERARLFAQRQQLQLLATYRVLQLGLFYSRVYVPVGDIKLKFVRENI